MASLLHNRSFRPPRLLLVVALVLVIAACSDDSSSTADPATTTQAPSTTASPDTTVPTGPVPEIVGGGSSFGECGGLCVGELRIDRREVSLTRRSWDRSEQVVAEGTLSEAARLQLDEMERALTGMQLDDTYGCPDCADGGAAWIDVVPVEAATRATYEFGNAPEVLAGWEDFRREVSEALTTCTTGDLVTIVEPCATEPSAPTGDEFAIVGGGSSFGMCFGYCVTELEIDGTALVLTRRAWEGISGDGFPDQVVEGELTAAGRTRLDAIEAELAATSLQETYGCPDCADGGAGWIEVRDAAGERRSTFDHQGPPEALGAADRLLRGWVDTLRECESDADVTSTEDCEPAVDPS
jgi:hypothetical protein